MTEQLWSMPCIHFARVDEDIIILDLVKDRYDCLLGATDSVQIASGGRILAANRSVAEQLREAGLTTDKRPETEPPPLISPRRELVLNPMPRRSDVLRAAAVLTTATLRFRGKSLRQLVASRPRLWTAEAPGQSRLSDLVGAVRAARPWIPFEGECLKRSFLLRSALASEGVATDWVFGVRTFPFAAHCWLQIGDMIVGDRLERAARFVPIMRA